MSKTAPGLQLNVHIQGLHTLIPSKFFKERPLGSGPSHRMLWQWNLMWSQGRAQHCIFCSRPGNQKSHGFFRGGHFLTFCSTGFIHFYGSEDNDPIDQCFKWSDFRGNAYIIGMFCFNSTPSWKSEPDFDMFLRNVSETCNHSSKFMGKLLKQSEFHLVKYRKPL